MTKTFNEMTRVQIPAMVHLTRIGYKYFGKISEEMSGSVYDPDTNILIDVFLNQFKKLNPDNEREAEQELARLRQELDNDDLGKSFYQTLKGNKPKLIDFDNPENNVFHFTAEFSCKNHNEEFRPDITLFVNGLPLVFVEVKIPNNSGGIIAESKRMTNYRFPNRYFRRFINITQLMIFSNNMEYSSDSGTVPIQGAFYCTGARKQAFFSSFREQNPGKDGIAPFHKNYPYAAVDKEVEKKILKDFNCQVLVSQPEYPKNCGINTPTNRILTSMCSPKRLLYILKYGIAYVKQEREIEGQLRVTDQKHIMRYQQLFASFAVTKKLDEGARSGIIWHTQGSGKTALSFYLTYILKDYFSRQNKVPKFYFIVDRIDLLEQASSEFEARGLTVSTASTRAELMAQFRRNQSLENSSGQLEITVVNIQRFAEDKEKVKLPEYATNLQRIFIIDEAHRGYKPGGCFLANLFDADKNSIKIALSGTPLLKKEVSSCAIFGNYIDTYYYSQSIEDGYTLKIQREDIETSWKEKLEEVYKSLNTLVEKKSLSKKDIIEHDTYVQELVRYVIDDLNKFRKISGENDLGGMVICESSEQARKFVRLFDAVQDDINETGCIKSHLNAELILYDSDDKETRKNIVEDFKANRNVDILVVYNMLLTGFDAPRLKRLYFGRKLKDHTLLQALTRVNRPYKSLQFGYVLDFADIKQNYEEINAAYLEELGKFTTQTIGIDKPTDVVQLIDVIVKPEELEQRIKQAKQVLFNYDQGDLEGFSQEISVINDKDELLEVKKALETLRSCANIIRLCSQETKDAFAKYDFSTVSEKLSEVSHRIDLINLQARVMQGDIPINEVMAGIEFKFEVIGSEELELVSKVEDINQTWNRAINAFAQNEDPEDPEYVTLREEFKRVCGERGFVYKADEIAKFADDKRLLDQIVERLNKLRKRNDNLKKHYFGDIKLVRVHKRVLEENSRRKGENKKQIISEFEDDIVEVLNDIKSNIDQRIFNQNHILDNDAFFERVVLSQVANTFQRFPALNQDSSVADYRFIQERISRQYLDQYNAAYT